MIKKIGIVGNGSFGTAITKVLTDNGNDVYWWLRSEETAKYIQERNHNSQYLQSVSFRPGSIEPTTDIHRLVSVCDTIVFAVPSAYAMQVLQQVSGEQWQKLHVISAIKGIIPETRQLLCDYLHERQGFSLDQYVAITGPCHAEEVAAERLSYLTFSGLNQDFASEVASLFQNEYIRTSFNHDIWGAQYAAVLKNIYAIGAGMAHALDYGDNFLSVFITACYRELWHFLNDHFHKIHPSNEVPDFHTSAYLGDLLVTGYSLHSRNRAFGSMIGKGYSVKSATLEMNMVAEGYYASRGMQTIAKQFQIELPIANMIYEILWEGLSAQVGFKDIEAKLS